MTARQEPPEPEKPPRFQSPYTRQALEWIAVAGFAGVVAMVIGVASAVIYWAWTA